ncbi:hypothetical protein BpHYR1_029884 [Brachionus plicatilis]|uniref:Uncharacterized protein n=1 Tax=Brachionus plicatilis TaxID=10195 RepID=A0A3M7PLQ9_BRAPC|nr:hypothetical protein BpHYR1_029884 [Brachionus plicatilis]
MSLQYETNGYRFRLGNNSGVDDQLGELASVSVRTTSSNTTVTSQVLSLSLSLYIYVEVLTSFLQSLRLTQRLLHQVDLLNRNCDRFFFNQPRGYLSFRNLLFNLRFLCKINSAEKIFKALSG